MFPNTLHLHLTHRKELVHMCEDASLCLAVGQLPGNLLNLPVQLADVAIQRLDRVPA